MFMIVIFTFIMGTLLFTDYVNVKMNEEVPMFRIKTTYAGNVIYYDTLFYDAYRCNANLDNEYLVITKNNRAATNELIRYCK